MANVTAPPTPQDPAATSPPRPRVIGAVTPVAEEVLQAWDRIEETSREVRHAITAFRANTSPETLAHLQRARDAELDARRAFARLDEPNAEP